jgi:hypothetical protein
MVLEDVGRYCGVAFENRKQLHLIYKALAWNDFQTTAQTKVGEQSRDKQHSISSFCERKVAFACMHI